MAGGGEDSTVRLFDLRACGPVGVYAETRKRVGVTGLAFSASGAVLFAAYEDPVCIAWEPMSADGVLHELVGDFTHPVTCIATNGLALAVGGGTSGQWCGRENGGRRGGVGQAGCSPPSK